MTDEEYGKLEEVGEVLMGTLGKVEPRMRYVLLAYAPGGGRSFVVTDGEPTDVALAMRNFLDQHGEVYVVQ